MEQMNKDELKRLCKLHGFSFTELGIYIQIRSKIDTYYVLNYDHKDSKITLYHQNSLGSAFIHKHKTHKDLIGLFLEIKFHDERYLVPGRPRKQSSIMNLLDQLRVARV